MSDYISGIFNYCDRWCERCAFTQRCRLFADEKKFEEKAREWSAFWEALEKAGCDLSQPGPVTQSDDAPRLKRRKRRRKKDDLLKAAEAYMDVAHAWLKAHNDQAEANTESAGGIAFADVFDVISWYHMQIFVKLTRAASGLRAAEKVKPWEEDELAEIDRYDANGSAKVALIGIERSLGAWTTLRTTFNRDDETVRGAVEQLARLRRAVDTRFPDGRLFHRPGFDD